MKKRILYVSACVVFLGVVAVIAAPGGSISGKVVDEDGNPLEGIPVSAKDNFTQTDSDGNFKLEVPKGPVSLNFQNVFLPEEGTFSRRLKSELPMFYFILPGQHRELGTIVYAKFGGILAGSVRDANDNPLTGCRVVIAKNDGQLIGVATTREDGSFTIKALRWSGESDVATVRVIPGGGNAVFAYEIGEWKAWSTKSVEFKVNQQKVGDLSGKVVLGDQPLSGAKVYLYMFDQASLYTLYPILKTDEAGKFLFSDIPARDYKLWVVSEQAGRKLVTVEATARHVMVSLDDIGNGTIEGKIEITIGGMAPPGITEEAAESGIRYAVYFCDEAGNLLTPLEPAALLEGEGGIWNFRCDNLSPGEYRLLVCSVEKTRQPVDLNSLDESFVNVFGQYALYEEWRPLPQDPLARMISESLVATVEAGKVTHLEVKRALSLEEYQQLMGW